MLDQNIEQQYDEVIKYVDGYRLFERSLRVQLLRLPLRHPMRYLHLTKEALTAIRQLNLLSGRNMEFNKMVAIEFATEELKSSEYYSIFTGGYPLHELSLAMENKFTDADFDKLTKLHEFRESQFSRLSVKGGVGIVLAIATVLLKSIPESVVSRIMDYKRFELIIFGTASIALISLPLTFLPYWKQYNQAKAVHSNAKQVLEYTCIRKSPNKPLTVGH